MTKLPTTFTVSNLNPQPPAPDTPLHQALAATQNMEHEFILAPQMPTAIMMGHAAARHGVAPGTAAQIYHTMIEAFILESRNAAKALVPEHEGTD